METYKQEFIDFMVEGDVLKFMTNTGMILTYYLDRLTREFQSAL